MKKSILKKQLFLCMGMLIISFVITGVLLTSMSSSYFIKNKTDQLIKQGEKISFQYTRAYLTGLIDTKQLNMEMSILEDYLNAKIVFVSPSGKVDFSSDALPDTWVTEFITQENFNKVMAGETLYFTGKNDSISKEPFITVCYPLIINNKVAEAFFMFAPLPEVTANAKEMQNIIVLSLLTSLIPGFMLVYLFTKKITTPLRKMSEVSKIMAMGNFEKRFEISSEDEIGELSKNLNEMAENLHNQEQIKRDFLTNISHDLRSPLTSIQGFLTAILDGTIENDKKEHYLNIVLDEVKRLSRLSHNLVSLTQEEFLTEIPHKEPFELNKLLRDCLNSFETSLIEKSLNVKLIKCSDSCLVFADIDKMQRVIYNLIDNAITFTNIGGNIIIEVFDEGDKYHVSVKDDGVGIPADCIGKIFDKFYKVDSSRGENVYAGGIGLSIVKTFLKEQDEYIKVVSTEGIGTEFIFSITKMNTKL